MINLAIVNDTVIAIEALRRAIATIPNYRLLWVAETGREAVQRCAAQRPDLILMDLHMPELDGVEATRQIMQHSPCAILIVTASVTINTPQVFKAMGYGALDVVKTPALGTGSVQAVESLLKKVAIAAKLTHSSAVPKPHRAAPPACEASRLSSTPSNHSSSSNDSSAHVPNLVIIGASTGGPNALQQILSQLPTTLSSAIVVIQHINAQFAPGLVDWLNQQTRLPVALARNGDRPTAGRVLIAGSNDHLMMRANGSLRYIHEPAGAIHRPSVDVFFSSVACHWQLPGTALLLTGMGQDGAKGMTQLKSARWHTVAQNAESCVVFGMPKAAIEQNAATQILPLSQMAAYLMRTAPPTVSVR